jgi:RimJ/RimL family protein N-acetyltransferase
MGTLAIDYAFERFEVDQIGGEALSSNPLSQKFHKKLGFIEDGRLERSLFRNDEWIDIYLFSLSRGHWQTKRGKAA